MTKFLIPALASALLITSCGNKAGNKTFSAEESKIIYDRMKEDHQYQYYMTDVDGDGRNEIFAMGSWARYTAYTLKADKITSNSDIEELLSTGDYSYMKFGNGHVVGSNAGFIAETPTQWVETNSIVLKDSKKQVTYWSYEIHGTKKYEEFEKYLPNEEDRISCSREEAIKHIEMELTDINDIPDSLWIKIIQ